MPRRLFRRLMVAAGCGLLAAGCGQGSQVVLDTEQDPNVPSSFTLDFGDAAGGKTRAAVSRTKFQLQVDAAAGTAQFLRYEQHVDPLNLPGGVSTGNITVKIVPGSSTGTYDSKTGAFETQDTYAIYFDGDLSAFGLTSPVMLPSTSKAVVNYESGSTGSVTLTWAGQGQLNNPFDPLNPIPFTYTCDVESTFQTQPARSVLFGAVR